MDYQTFRTRREAKDYIATMQGWEGAYVDRLLTSDDETQRAYRVWVVGIRPQHPAGTTQYLRTDGYIR